MWWNYILYCCLSFTSVFCSWMHRSIIVLLTDTGWETKAVIWGLLHRGTANAAEQSAPVCRSWQGERWLCCPWGRLDHEGQRCLWVRGSCHPAPFFSPSAVKAPFLPTALCPREGGGGAGGLHGEAGMFWFSPWRRALSQDPFEDAMSFQCMGVAERAEHLQDTQSIEKRGPGWACGRMNFCGFTAPGVLEGSGCFCVWKWWEAANLCVWTGEGKGLASTPMVSEFSLPCKCFSFFCAVQVFLIAQEELNVLFCAG